MGRTVITRKDIPKLQRRIAQKQFDDIRGIRDFGAIDSQTKNSAEELDFSKVTDLIQSSQQEPDTYQDRLLKYIPSEILALYVTLDTGLRTSTETTVDFGHLFIYWFVFIILTFITPLYLKRIAKVTKLSQLTISTIAFILWIFALGGPFNYLSWYEPMYGGILLSIYTLLVATIEAT